MRSAGAPAARRYVDTITRTSHCESFTVSGTGYNTKRCAKAHAGAVNVRNKKCESCKLKVSLEQFGTVQNGVQ